MLPSSDTITKVAQWRQAARDGTLTQDQMREAIVFLRAERTATPAGKKTTAKATVDTKSLFDELDGL